MYAATLTTNKTTYSPTDATPIEVNFNGMTGLNKDWIAIYPAGTDNAWKNVIKWAWTGDKSSGKVTLVTPKERHTLLNGKYEARAFYNNSYKLEAKVAFEIKGIDPHAPHISLPKKIFTTYNKISIKFKNMINANQDWIAIYPAGSNNAFSNVLDWKWTGDKPEGNLTFKALPEGDYEIRAFYNNSAATVYARETFSVKEIKNISTQEILHLAHQCDNQDPIHSNVLCSNDSKKAYVLFTKRIDGDYIYSAHYAVTLENDHIELIEEKTIEAWEQYRYENLGYFFKKFKTSPIYITKTHHVGEADDYGSYKFFLNNKKILTIPWRERERSIYDNSIKILDNGKKLYLERYIFDEVPNLRKEKWKETYDISKPNKATLINREVENLLEEDTSLEAVAKHDYLFFRYRSNHPSDWIGIYKKGDSVAWSNVIKWEWLKDISHEESIHIRGAGSGPNHIDFHSTHLYKGFNQNLPKGKYEARVFKDNSFKVDRSYEFTVE